MTSLRQTEGFPAGVRFTPVPDPFIKAALLEIDDLAEIKASLYVIWLLHRKKGYPGYVTFHELLADSLLIRGLSGGETPGDDALRRALAKAVARGIFLKVAVIRNSDRQELFLLNTAPGRKAVAEIQSGGLDLGRPLYVHHVPAAVETPDIFQLYEENIGLLTPLIADELREAEKAYPPSWLPEAFGEAVALNKRNWRYISRILERWAIEGKSHGKPGRYSQKASRT